MSGFCGRLSEKVKTKGNQQYGLKDGEERAGKRQGRVVDIEATAPTRIRVNKLEGQIECLE